ncbi:MAG: hypothetical protein K9N47_03680 [Prosthecobacter sp.]|uniref:hypothetical protein n=1 Tax=Prosthecobacter sp. TaxID=1965333 RepID=UPI0025FF1D4E|nr:hypothetical protein [Prosthecobacter sp.]MCF7785195.1 hypothetical protein [Prosthecobacter sp.]
MNTPLLALNLLLVTGLTACHKQSGAALADMDAETRLKAIAIRAAADKETAATNEAAILQKIEARESPTPLK